jgi:hypothetical protein
MLHWTLTLWLLDRIMKREAYRAEAIDSSAKRALSLCLPVYDTV